MFCKHRTNIIPENFQSELQQQKMGPGFGYLRKNCYALNIWIVILAGLGATLVMTCFTLIMSHILKKPFYVVMILAMMLPFKKDVSTPTVFVYITATFLHYFIGVNHYPIGLESVRLVSGKSRPVVVGRIIFCVLIQIT